MSEKTTLELQHGSILFADIRGYNNLSKEENIQFHRDYFPNLWSDLITKFSPDLEHSNLWGDGIMCISRNLIKLSKFALHLAEAFDGIEWKGNINKPLRLRIALDSGYLYLSAQASNNQIEQYISTQMVKPARLEPVVRPGQVWCTSRFRQALLKEVNNDISKLEFILDDFKEIPLAQNYNPNAVVARIRAKRQKEEELQQYELAMKKAQRDYDGASFCRIIQKLLAATSDEFVYLSKYLSWYEVVIAMVELGRYQEASKILEQFQDYVGNQGWMSEENAVYFTCLLASCLSKKRDANAQDLQQILEHLESLFNDAPNELSILIAESYKKVAISLSSYRDIGDNKKYNFFIQCHNMFEKIFFKKTEIEKPRLFPELAPSSVYKTFNHRAAINIAETALMAQCLSRDKENSFETKKQEFANLLITWFRSFPPDPHSESEILAFVLAYLLLGEWKNAAQVLRGREIPSELKEIVEYLGDFPRMIDSITIATDEISAIITD